MNKIKISLNENENKNITIFNNILELDIVIARRIYDKMLLEYTCEDILHHIKDLIEDNKINLKTIKQYSDEDNNINKEILIMLAEKVILKEDSNIDYNSIIDSVVQDFLINYIN